MCCRLYADQLAAEGFLVLLPDIFHGDALSEGFDKSQFSEWMQKHPQDMQVNQLDRLLTDMHQQYKPKSVSCIGFCWGGRHACMLANSDRVSSAVVVHGSFITKEVVEAVKQPILFLFADQVIHQHITTPGCHRFNLSYAGCACSNWFCCAGSSYVQCCRALSSSIALNLTQITSAGSDDP